MEERKILKESWKEYDENNNLIHSKDSDGFEEWYEYDENNNCTRITRMNSKNVK